MAALVCHVIEAVTRRDGQEGHEHREGEVRNFETDSK